MPKLGIYIIEATQDDQTSYFLMVDASAESAQSRVFDKLGYQGTISGVGRLGDYEPGIEGHQMVVSLEVGRGYILSEVYP